MNISSVQLVLAAIEDEPITAQEIAAKTGLACRVCSSRLSLLRERGDVFSIPDPTGMRRVTYVRKDHPLAVDPEIALCHVSNAWVARA